jgi:hypothetical protein
MKTTQVVQGKGKKDRYVPFDSFDTGIKKNTLQLKNQRLSFNGQPLARSGGDFDSRYSQQACNGR